MFRISYSHKRPLFFILLSALVLLLILSFATRKYVSIDKTYTDKNYVALYILTYHELPSNYYIKSSSDSREYTANVIGGYIHSYQDVLPRSIKNNRLRECDIYFDGYTSTNRGQSRLVYTSNVKHPRVFFTNDHYSSYKELTEFSINIASYIFLILFFCLLTILIIHHIIVIKRKYGKFRNIIEWSN